MADDRSVKRPRRAGRPPDPRRIGRIGEQAFRSLCVEASLTHQMVEQDDYGWDAIVEFDPTTPPTGSADLRPSIQTAKVQIKTTTTASRTIVFKLSNLVIYAKDASPTFLVLHVVEQDKPGRWFARHVWMPEIAEWLKRVREEGEKGVSAFNQIDVPVRFGDEDEVGGDLLEWIETAIDDAPKPYETMKQKIMETIGFNGVKGVAHVSAPISARGFLDLMLGVIPSIRIKRFAYHSVRFGITASAPDEEFRDVDLSVIPEETQGRIRFEFPNGRQIAIAARKVSAQLPNGESILVADRIRSASIDLIIGPGEEVRFAVELDTQRPMSMKEHAVFANLQALKEGDAVSINLDFPGLQQQLATVRITQTAKSEAWTWMALWIEVLMTIAAKGDYPLPDVPFQALETGLPQLETLGALGSNHHLRIDCTPEPDIPESYGGFLAFGIATVGDKSYGAVVRREIIDDRMVGHRRQIGIGASRIVYGIVDTSETIVRERVNDAYWAHLNGYRGKTELIAINDIYNWMTDGTGDKPLIADRPDDRLEGPTSQGRA